MNTFQSFLIAGGNSTLLAPADSARERVIKKYLGTYEQIGFVCKKNVPCLEMMGNELCINATLAFAFTLKNKGILQTSGLENFVVYTNRNRVTEIIVFIPFRRTRNIILLNGIGYICLRKKTMITKQKLKMLSQRYNLPAFGVLAYQDNIITPAVYVRKTDSFIQESSCGSGSIAFNIYKNKNIIIQPTGKQITVERSGNTFTIQAEVTKLQL